MVWFKAFNTESESSQKKKYFVCLSQVLIKSKARSTDLASVVTIDESSGIRCILIWLPDITAQPTIESSLTHQY